jgi:hypothetical protein
MRHASLATLIALLLAAPALAKIPAPVLSDEAKAKAAEAAAKTAWSNKVADYQLCKSMDRTAAKYFASMKQSGKDAKPPADVPACADPGPFVAPGAAPAPAPAATVAPAKKS